MKEGASLSTSMLISLLIHIMLISLGLIVASLSPEKESESLQVVLAPASPPSAVGSEDNQEDRSRSPQAPETVANAPETTPESSTDAPVADPIPSENRSEPAGADRRQPSDSSRPPETGGGNGADEPARADEPAGGTSPPAIPESPEPLDWQVPRERDRDREESSPTPLNRFLDNDEQSDGDRSLEEWRSSNASGTSNGDAPGLNENAPADQDPAQGETVEDSPGESGPNPELADDLARFREQSQNSDSSTDPGQATETGDSTAPDTNPASDPGPSSAESLRRQGISGDILRQGRDLISEDRLDLSQYLEQRDPTWRERITVEFRVDEQGIATILNEDAFSPYNRLADAIRQLFNGPMFQPDPGAPPVRGEIIFQIR